MARSDDDRRLSRLIKQYPNLARQLDGNRQSWLWNAAKFGRANCAAILLMHGADPNDNRQALTPFELAIRNGHKELVAMLWQAGGRSDEAVRLAAVGGHADIALMLLARGADIEGANPEIRHTPLHEAAIAGNDAMVRLLIENGANVNTADGLGYSPLDNAMYYWHASTAAILKAHGAKRLRKN